MCIRDSQQLLAKYLLAALNARRGEGPPRRRQRDVTISDFGKFERDGRLEQGEEVVGRDGESVREMGDVFGLRAVLGQQLEHSAAVSYTHLRRLAGGRQEAEINSTRRRFCDRAQRAAGLVGDDVYPRSVSRVENLRCDGVSRFRRHGDMVEMAVDHRDERDVLGLQSLLENERLPPQAQEDYRDHRREREAEDARAGFSLSLIHI